MKHLEDRHEYSAARRVFNTLLAVSSGAIKHETQCFITGRDFARKTKSRGGTLIARAYIKESTYS